MRAAGITGWVLGHRFGNYVIDIAFPDAMLAVEIDGWAWHMGVDLPQPPGAATVQITGGINAGPRLTAAFRADRHKSNALVRARWDLLRFTWHDLTNRPDYVIAEIRAALAAAASAR